MKSVNINRILIPPLICFALSCTTSARKPAASAGAPAAPSAPAEVKAPPPASAKLPHEAVVSYHALATAIGQQILDRGGNAFDAFVATTAAQYVLSEGVTSLSGPLGALLYDAKSRHTYYLDAGFNEPLNTPPKFDPKHAAQTAGAPVLVPGAPAGLEAISKRFGRLPFRAVLEPAIALAREGFDTSLLMAHESRGFSTVLKRSAYGKSTYMRNGRPLAEGDKVKLPVLAVTLEHLANDGSVYFYKGRRAQEAVSAVRKKQGTLTLEDFSRYEAQWREPLNINYRGYELFAPSGRTYHGLTALLALKALENDPSLTSESHFTKDGAALEKVVRAEDWAEVYADWLAFTDHAKKIDDQPKVQKSIAALAKVIWSKVQAHADIPQTQTSGSHSYQVVVIDRDGNAITGTNTIESLPWGQGLFVEGVPLTDSGRLPFATSPGERRLMGLSMHLGFKDSKLAFAAGAFGSSLAPAELQFILNVVDFKMGADQAMQAPRFGIQGVDLLSNDYKPTGRGRWLDRRVDANVVKAAEALGLKLDQEGMNMLERKHYMDLGLGALAIVEPDGGIESAIAPLNTIGAEPN